MVAEQGPTRASGSFLSPGFITDIPFFLLLPLAKADSWPAKI